MKKVLIIDDNLSTRQILQIALSYFGWDILEAPNGREGLLLAIDRRPDAILLDWRMPEMDGLTVLYHLRSSSVTKDIPAIVLTAEAHLLPLVQLSRLGVAALIAKPFEPVMLSQQIARVLCQDLPHSKQENTPLTARSIDGNSGTAFW
jgi:CheY-like chemotaxis protein